MNVPRRTQLRILRVLNQYVPPAVRDAPWFGRTLLRLAFRQGADLVADFKVDAWSMTDQQLVDVNRRVATLLPTDTDLNDACLDRVLARVTGRRVLEVGCGQGLLASRLAEQFDVTACDLVLPDGIAHRYPTVDFREANAERLPFPDQSFDTVISTHMLEHVRDFGRTLAELRRVCGGRLIIVVPCERPYRYTFNLHLHFFPYPHSLRAAVNGPPDSICEVLDGDLYYEESVRGPAEDQSRLDS